MLPTVIGAFSVPPREARVRIVEIDIVKGHAGRERLVRTNVVNVVALNTFVHCSKAAAQHCFVIAGEIISEADARTEVQPGILYQAARNTRLAGDADPFR